MLDSIHSLLIPTILNDNVSVEINFTASHFYVEQLFMNLFLIHFQTKDSVLYVYVHS